MNVERCQGPSTQGSILSEKTFRLISPGWSGSKDSASSRPDVPLWGEEWLGMKQNGSLPFRLPHQVQQARVLMLQCFCIISCTELARIDAPHVSGFSQKTADGGQFITSINSQAQSWCPPQARHLPKLPQLQQTEPVQAWKHFNFT